jgi:MoaA/NifB/PqqE/SkfB family radical SAM enzyme
MTLKTLMPFFRKLGCNVEFGDDVLTVDGTRLQPYFTEATRRLFYLFLNKFESDYLIFIKGLPFCFLPEACDHLIYRNERSIRYEKPDICRVCRFRAACPGLRCSQHMLKMGLSPVSDVPRDIAIEINSSCNLRCRFCQHDHSGGRELPLGRIREVLDAARRIGVRSVRFTGGEPLLRKDILEILRMAKSRGFFVFLNTNATLLTDGLLGQLEKLVDNILVSLCGYSVATEDMINRKGSGIVTKFKNVLKVSRSRIPVKRLGTVITRLLINDFDRYAAVVSRLGIKNWELYRPMISQASSQDRLYDVKGPDYEKLLVKMARFKKNGFNVYVANAFPFCVTRRKALRPLMRGASFDDGHSRVVLDVRGFFKPSYFIEKNLGRSLARAWQRPFMKKMRLGAYIPVSCRECIYRNPCLGGSRFMAHEVNGAYAALDPLSKPLNVVFRRTS